MAKKTINFTASFMKWNKSKLTDVFGGMVGNIDYSGEQMLLKYRKPTIIYDFTLQGAETKTPVLRDIKTAKEVEELGYYVCTIPPPKEWRWPNRRRAVVLIRKGSLDDKYAKRIVDITKPGVKCVYDEANLRIKLVGERTSPLGESQWFEVSHETNS